MTVSRHFNRFRQIFPTSPDDQGPVGNPVAPYLDELRLAGESTDLPAKYSELEHSTLSRPQVLSLCKDSSVSDLVAYAIVMAWGGRDRRNFLYSISDKSLPHLKKIVARLRGSKRSRKTDFAEMATAAENIKGLKVSFYTKLLFFLRSNQDAYILDQFTAKSAHLLFDESPVPLGHGDMPNPDHAGEQYEHFCRGVEDLCRLIRKSSGEWSPQLAEQAMFDKRGGQWRRYIATCFPKKKSSARGTERRTNQSASPLYKVGITKNMRTDGTWFFPRKLSDRLGSAGKPVILHFPNGNRARGRIGHSKGKFLNEARSALREFVAKHPKATSFDAELAVLGGIQTLKITI
jgi:hypothetical protein